MFVERPESLLITSKRSMPSRIDLDALHWRHQTTCKMPNNRSEMEQDSASSCDSPSSGAASPKDRPFMCQEPGCGKRFNRKFTLSEHMKTHTGEKPYQCPVHSCGKRFSTSGNLSRHKRLHASIKPFECSMPDCQRTFQTQVKLERHMKIHMGARTHTCMVPGCGKTFSTAGNLTRHSKNQHSGTSPPEHGNIESWINPVPFDSKEDEFAVFTDEMVELLRNLEPEAPVYHHPQSRTYHPAPGFFQGILRP